MDHLTLDEIIDFVSLTDLNEESIQLMGAVNAHIARCRECRELVRSYQLVYDEMIRTGVSGGFGVKTAMADGPIAAISAAEMTNDFEG